MTNMVSAILYVLSHVATVSDVRADRLRAVTEDIVAVVQSEIKSGRVKALTDEVEAVSMLAGAVTNESAFSRDYETCKKTGDGGRSLGLGQVIHPWGWKRHKKEEICSNRRLQLALALYNLDECWAITPDAAATFRCFTTGSAKRDSGAARREYGYYRRFKAALTERNVKELKVVELDLITQEHSIL